MTAADVFNLIVSGLECFWRATRAIGRCGSVAQCYLVVRGTDAGSSASNTVAPCGFRGLESTSCSA